MEQIKKDLEGVSRSLRQLSQKTDQIAKQLGRLARAQSPKKSRAKKATGDQPAKAAAAGKPGKSGAVDKVLNAIKRSKKGIDVATLKKKTGFEGRRANDIVYRLVKQGKIKSSGRGVYVIA